MSAGTVLVTGGARRLGRSIALELASAGWQVAVHFRASADDAQQTVADCARHAASEAFQADLAEEAQVGSLFERADNALKLIGDQYLSRIFDLASTRFHLRDWQQSIRRKLDTVGDVYDLLVQQSGVRRTETLEVVVILLIALEVVLALVRH